MEELSKAGMEVGQRLVELCQADKDMQAVEELYADNIVSEEAMGAPGMPRIYEGKEAVMKKQEWWYANHEVHESSCEGPFPHGDQFIVIFGMDVTCTGGPMEGQRFKMKEAALYTVEDGKIVNERFFYTA